MLFLQEVMHMAKIMNKEKYIPRIIDAAVERRNTFPALSTLRWSGILPRWVLFV